MQNEIIKNEKSDILTLIEEKNLLDPSTQQQLMEAKEFIAETYTDVPMYRPLPVKLFGVLNDKDFPTPEQKYWQCKVEAEVHANELIRDLHDLELQKLEIEKIELLIEKIKTKIDMTSTDLDRKLIELDIKEQLIYISRKRFEIKQTEKRIKHRILEVGEWKKISDGLKENNNINLHDYIQHYSDKIKYNLEKKLTSDKTSDVDKNGIKTQLQIIETVLNKFN